MLLQHPPPHPLPPPPPFFLGERERERERDPLERERGARALEGVGLTQGVGCVESALFLLERPPSFSSVSECA